MRDLKLIGDVAVCSKGRKEKEIHAFYVARKNRRIQSEMHEINKIPISLSIIIELSLYSGCNLLRVWWAPSYSQQSVSRCTLLLIHPDSTLPWSKRL